MNDSYTRLVDSLNDVRRHWRSRLLGAGLLAAAAVTAAALIVTVALDNWLRLGTVGRLFLALVLWGTMAATLFLFVLRRWLLNRRDDFFAAMVEQKHPELHNLLVNALQLGRETTPSSPRLIAAIVKDAATATAGLELADCLDSRPVKRAASLAGGGALLVSVYAFLFTAQFGNGLVRVVLPLAPIAPYTATRVTETSIKPGNTRVPEGAAINMAAAVTGVVPETARLVHRAKGKPWQPAPMQADPRTRAAFQCTIAPALESFDYYVAAGDGRSATYRIEVVKRPQIGKLDLTYTLPPYAGQTPRPATDASGDIAGVAGTTVAIAVHATKPLREVTLVTEGEQGQAIVLAKAGDDRTWRGTFVIWSGDAKGGEDIPGQHLRAPTRYSIRLLDTDGYDNGDAVWHSVTLIRDQPPTVAITAPARDLQLKPDETVPLAVEARDDYGLGAVQILYRVNDESAPRVLTAFPHDGPPVLQTHDEFVWKLADLNAKPGELIQYWAAGSDRNNITGPGKGESRRFSIFIVAPQQIAAKVEMQVSDFAQFLEELLRLQSENRAQTASAVAFETLALREVTIRTGTAKLARAIEAGAVPMPTVVQALDELGAGLMADAVHLFESGRDTQEPTRATAMRDQSLPVQDKIIAQLQALLARLQRNEQAREALRKLAKTDKPSHQAITEALTKMVKDLDRMLAEEKQLDTKFEKLPKHTADDLNKESLDTIKEAEGLQEKWAKWAAGKVDELAKLPTGFVDDFGLRPDVKRIFEEIEAGKRHQAEKVQVAIEDNPMSGATKMKEDLEVWMPDTADYAKWMLEEPLANKPMNVPEMPLPSSLEDMIGDLLQKEDEFDQEADDLTSAWGDNMDQAGWGVSDGPTSIFSAKGKTGNDLPNTNELSGRSGDGRRGKSSGQMVGDTARALQGRKTPARVTAERYEPGSIKPQAYDDPNGATGGGKKSGAGQRGLQGGTPPDFVKDMQRLSAKQALIREKAEKLAQRLDVTGVSSRRLTESVQLMKTIEQDYHDLRYDDAARHRRVALGMLDGSLTDLDQPTGVALSRARQLPAAMRQELLQSADEGYPAGYEALLKNYFRTLSETEK